LILYIVSCSESAQLGNQPARPLYQTNSRTSTPDCRPRPGKSKKVCKLLRRQRDKVAAGLEAIAKPPRLAELHPPSVDPYLAAIDKLSEHANGRLAAEDDELAQCLRKFLDSVTVLPAARG